MIWSRIQRETGDILTATWNGFSGTRFKCNEFFNDAGNEGACNPSKTIYFFTDVDPGCYVLNRHIIEGNTRKITNYRKDNKKSLFLGNISKSGSIFICVKQVIASYIGDYYFNLGIRPARFSFSSNLQAVRSAMREYPNIRAPLVYVPPRSASTFVVGK